MLRSQKWYHLGLDARWLLLETAHKCIHYPELLLVAVRNVRLVSGRVNILPKQQTYYILKLMQIQLNSHIDHRYRRLMDLLATP